LVALRRLARVKSPVVQSTVPAEANLRSILVLLSIAACATSVLAQNYPTPSAVPDPPAICTGCPGNNSAGEPNADKPTFPYDTPLQVHAGRYVDSSSTITVQNVGMRTVRSGLIRRGGNRIYLQLGATIGAYDFDRFFTQKLKQPMVAVNTINTGRQYGNSRNPFERLAKPDRFFYPEANGTGWSTPLVDASTVLKDFDVDDRGYIYLGTANFGWGIVSDPGGTNGSLLPSVVQVAHPSVRPDVLLSMRSGSNYYVYYSNAMDKAELYDVTDPAAPAFVSTRTAPGATFSRWSKYEAGQRVALLHADGWLRIYNYSGLLASFTLPVLDMPPTAGKFFFDLSFDDEGNLWVAEGTLSASGTGNVLRKLTPSGAGYTSTTYDVYGASFSPRKIHAAAGYVAVGGATPGNGTDLRLFRVTAGVPEIVATSGFFEKYYHKAPSGYAQPSFSLLVNPRIIAQGEKTYLFYSAHGLGDVYELGEGPRITSMTPLSGLPAGGTNVSIYGTGFAAGANVTFGGTAASSTVVSLTRIDAVSPMHASGSVDVVVDVPALAAMTAPRQFTYVLPVPQGLIATATSTTSVAVSWNASAGATHYEVLRRAPDGTSSVIGSPTGTSFDDTGRTPETTYIYRVRAVDAAANESAASALDLATTMSSETSTIVVGSPVRAADFILLRNRADALRAAAGLPAYPYPGAIEGVILAQHLYQLRDALSYARASLGLPRGPFTDDNATGAVIKAQHLNELLELLR
jgi:IPT/TIG domain